MLWGRMVVMVRIELTSAPYVVGHQGSAPWTLQYQSSVMLFH